MRRVYTLYIHLTCCKADVKCRALPRETPLYFDRLSYNSRWRDLRSRSRGSGRGAWEGTYVKKKKNSFEKKNRVTTGSGILCSRCSGWEIVSETYPASERVAVHTYVPLKGASERGARWLLQRLVAWVC